MPNVAMSRKRTQILSTSLGACFSFARRLGIPSPSSRNVCRPQLCMSGVVAFSEYEIRGRGFHLNPKLKRKNCSIDTTKLYLTSLQNRIVSPENMQTCVDTLIDLGCQSLASRLPHFLGRGCNSESDTRVHSPDFSPQPEHSQQPRLTQAHVDSIWVTRCPCVLVSLCP